MSRHGSFLSCVVAATCILIPLATAGPCDIFASGGTPCVAAHSTTRALYSDYSGPLYQVLRSDGSTKDIGVCSQSGSADISSQYAFCARSACLISKGLPLTIRKIYDQSGNDNDLTAAPSGGNAVGLGIAGSDQLADASAAQVMVNGRPAHGVYVSPGVGYRNDATHNMPTGDDAQGIYAVLDGTHYNGKCCFDYGNAETNNNDNGPGHMQALYFGSQSLFGAGAGGGPWVLADMEDGTFSGQSKGGNPNNPSVPFRFVTGMINGAPDYWEILVGDATNGGLTVGYAGPRPVGYEVMHQEGAIILGIGGDNSNSGEGTFYEGAITDGIPSDDTDRKVQADIVSAQYSASRV
ncbi:alpha-L-arabinofuranosidase B [Xylariaceae sp. FL1019]|nr:alpha-L-arabinofuranosidase B [Xylariaceae sp. FL1019]